MAASASGVLRGGFLEEDGVRSKKKRGGVRELDAAFCSFHPLSSSTPPNLDSFAAARGGGELEIHGAGERVAGEGGIVVRVVFLSLVCCYIFLMLLASPLLSFPRPRAQREHAHTHTHTQAYTQNKTHTHYTKKMKHKRKPQTARGFVQPKKQNKQTKRSIALALLMSPPPQPPPVPPASGGHTAWIDGSVDDLGSSGRPLCRRKGALGRSGPGGRQHTARGGQPCRVFFCYGGGCVRPVASLHRR